VLAMSYDIPGLVETSTNLARIRVEADGKLHLIASNRSSVASALTYTRRRVRAIGELAGAQVTELDGYPGWKPNVHSPLLEIVKKAHVEALGFEPKVGAIHAGLECGIIGEKRPGMDMISIGPTIQFPHSPDERVEIDTVGRFWGLLTKTLAALA
jgi:dipeptidase D